MVRLSVSVSVTLVYAAKTAEPIEMPFGMRARVGRSNQVLDGDPDLPRGRGNFGNRYTCAMGMPAHRASRIDTVNKTTQYFMKEILRSVTSCCCSTDQLWSGVR